MKRTKEKSKFIIGGIVVAIAIVCTVFAIIIANSNSNSEEADNGFDVNYTANVELSSSTGKAKVTDTTKSYPAKKISFTVSNMKKKGETVTAIYNITNTSANLGANLGAPKCYQTDEKSYISVASTLGTAVLTEASGDRTSTSQTVIVTLTKTQDEPASTTITCTLTATAAESE